MKTALWMKDAKVPLVIECFDAIYHKLLQINITNIDQLMTEIHTNRINLSLRNVHKFGFNRQSTLKIMIFAGEAKRIPTVSYTTPLQEAFNLNKTDNNNNNNNNKLDYSNTTTEILQEVLLTVSFNMKKLFPIRWTNEVFCKFLLINVKSLDILLHHIMDGMFNPKLKSNIYLSMNNTTLQVLARASPHFSIDCKYNVDTTSWTIGKKRGCFNCNTIGCNRWKCPQPINRAECNRIKKAWLEEGKKDNKFKKECKNNSVPHEWHPPSKEERGNVSFMKNPPPGTITAPGKLTILQPLTMLLLQPLAMLLLLLLSLLVQSLLVLNRKLLTQPLLLPPPLLKLSSSQLQLVTILPLMTKVLLELKLPKTR